MQTAVSRSPVEQRTWLAPEEQSVTFQIALVGSDGVVVASDQLGQHMRMIGAKPQLAQITRQPKYVVSDNRSMVCFFAGGAMAPNLARQIILECDPVLKLNGATESEWQDAVYRVIAAAMLPYSYPIDELLLVRADVFDAFWLLSRRFAGQGLIAASLQKVSQHFCTGDNVVAQFLPRHLWRRDRTVSELKTLALLTLSYAAQEDPSSVGPPFDVMTLGKKGHLAWSVHGPVHEKFQSDLERLFREYEG